MTSSSEWEGGRRGEGGVGQKMTSDDMITQAPNNFKFILEAISYLNIERASELKSKQAGARCLSKFVDKVVRHICTVVFCRVMVWLSLEGFKGKIRDKTKVGSFT